MRKAVTAAVSAIVIATTLGATPATAGSLGRFEVTGVDEDDMLKMRAGPGTGFIVLLGARPWCSPLCLRGSKCCKCCSRSLCLSGERSQLLVTSSQRLA